MQSLLGNYDIVIGGVEWLD